MYTELFVECSLETGKHLSKAEREENKLTDVKAGLLARALSLDYTCRLQRARCFKSLIYGEVDFHSFARVLRKINPVPGGVFYDLGSGTAKAVFVGCPASLMRFFAL